MRDNQEMMSRLGELLAIESVAKLGGPENAPYGAGPAAALDYMLKLCDFLGFRTKNCENQLGWAEIGAGDEMVGILVVFIGLIAGFWFYSGKDQTAEIVD